MRRLALGVALVAAAALPRAAHAEACIAVAVDYRRVVHQCSAFPPGQAHCRVPNVTAAGHNVLLDICVPV